MDATVRQDTNSEELRRLVNPGWDPLSWAARLRRLADACERMHADLAQAHRQRADRIEQLYNLVHPAAMRRPSHLDPEIEEAVRRSIAESKRVAAAPARVWRY